MLSNSRFFIRTLLVILIAIVTWIALTATAAPGNREHWKLPGNANRADGLAAWQKVYSVLTSPRCINCHTATNYPQQGDDRHRHFANVIRGPEGNGVPGFDGVSCDQEASANSTGAAGGHNWHLALLSMRRQAAKD